ncbi:hypothetical protein PFISCL1PPCAC_17567, partial [Pristionchus fissidentatus]
SPPLSSSLLLISLISTARSSFVSTRISAKSSILLFSPPHLLRFHRPLICGIHANLFSPPSPIVDGHVDH